MMGKNTLEKCFVVTPSNANDIISDAGNFGDLQAAFIQVVATGDIVVHTADSGEEITITAAPVGFVLLTPIRRVLSTGTTATVIAGRIANG